ncbi:energy-coupling factor transporter transmembrane component T [Kineothrix sedimenti]|uniref:Energy-coupling factor transporter transmembrane component T n=1 Tax=Kineothrix sedimenti TaxID=3123317 RepID=A0ABZ3ERY0_9FIRM
MKHENMRKTVLGYVPIQSPIYLLHPVTRIILYLVMSFVPLLIQMPEVNLILLIGTLCLFKFSRIDMRQLKIYVPMMILVACFITFSYIVFPTKMSGEIPIVFFGFKLYLFSIMWAVMVYVRIITLLLASIFFFSTNRERDILVGLRCLRVPFAVSYFLGLTLRSAGMFLEDYGIVKEAERARGLDMENEKFLTKVSHFPMYMIPLFTLAIRRSEDISTGLYAKGTEIKGTYKGMKRPDYLRTKFKKSALDSVVSFAAICFFAGAVILKISINAFELKNSILNIWFGNIL